MKYAILIGDGMGDYPIDKLDGRTPLEAADIPHMDTLARKGLLGLARTIPEGKDPGSDVANMSIMGYDPLVYHTGRAPLEAASMGIDLTEDEVAFRLNLVNLEFKPGGQVIMRDHSADNITTEEAAAIVDALNHELPMVNNQKIYPGVSYRHLLVWPGLEDSLPTFPPHDYRGQAVTDYLNQEGAMKILLDFIRASWPVLEKNPINVERESKGLLPANSIWPWGQGRPSPLPSYQERWGLTGSVISAVDLVKGLGKTLGLTPIEVEGATGFIDTNYEGKVKAALNALKTVDLVLVHVEAPDEAGHQGDLEKKVKAIELFDRKVVGPMLEGLKNYGEFRLALLCDHFTPVSAMTHTPEPVPFVIYPGPANTDRAYTEKQARSAGLYLEQGHTLIKLLLGGTK